MSTTKRRSTKKTTTKKAASKTPGRALPSHRKQEILGLILMTLAVLVALALLTYTPSDDLLARDFSWRDAFDPRTSRAANALGLVGAALAYALVPNFLGYPTLVLTGVVFAWGYVFFRQKKALFLPLVSVLSLVATVIVACLIGWVDLQASADLARWSGDIGQGVAGWMQQVFGRVGSFILLVLAALVTALLLIDRDIQRTLDRVEEGVGAMRRGLVAWWSGFRDGQRTRKAERAAILEERRKVRDAERKTKEHEAQAQSKRAADAAKQAAAAERAKQMTGPVRASTPPDLPPPSALAMPPAPTPSRESVPPPPSRPTRAAAPTASKASASAEPEVRVRGPVEEAAADLDARIVTVNAADLPYDFPSIELLEAHDPRQSVDMAEIEENKRVLLDKLETYKIEITAIEAVVGPTVTRYELTPAPGIKISKITSLEDDLAMAMAAPGIRIIAPIPGKSAVGVEIPNRHREMVRLRSMLATARFRDAASAQGSMALPVALGKTIEGEVFLQDLAKMPHLLVAGATGSGKSVGINTLIVGLLYACHPADLKFVLVDPKKIELNTYADLLDHFLAMPEDADEPIITDFLKAASVLRSCEREMEQRYDLLADAGVRGIQDYNRKVASGLLEAETGHRHLPHIVVVIDELADLMMTSGKEVEPPIARLAQMARAVGIHLVIATQRPSVDVITGLIKANFPSRAAFQVASRIDSRTILDRGGAQQLVGNGDMLYMNGSRVTRIQGPFVSVDEVGEVVGHIAEQEGAGPYFLPPMEAEESGPTLEQRDGATDRDDLFEDAARVIVRSQQGSVSLLQRKLSVGYTRAARLVDQLEDAGIVGPFEGSKARAVLVATEMDLDTVLRADRDGGSPAE
ncbi:MAG: DNA translocase FtsK 4TM domain-containing protein [Bacteroidota bacterium]